jgi:hypothetical protein
MMKNKLFLGILAAAMVCGLALSACKNGVQDVKQVYDKVGGVGNLKAVKTTDNLNVLVSWDAVDGAGGYILYYKVADTKTVTQISGGGGINPQNAVTYAVANGASSTNTNPDKWSVLITIAGSPVTAGTSYVFGVRASPLGYSSNVLESDIVWADALTL